MHVKTDHTVEVEQRIAAIRISPYDGCLFFLRRDKTLVNLCQCFYCAYAVFEGDERNIQQQGLCKFKR